jgi:RNA polymerase sigma-70 factor (ECF subfamily)
MAGMLGTVAGDDNTGELVITRDTPAELEVLYAAHARSLTQALFAAGYPDAADAVQEAFVQAVVHWRKVSRYDDPLAWIRRVAINRGHNRRRSRKRQEALQQRIAASPTTPVRTYEADDDLSAMVSALPQQQRLALSLFYYSDLSIAEVADAMQLSEGAVKYHLHTARASLARSLEVRDDS